MKRQREIGDKIKSQILKEVLGDTDYVYLNSEIVFGIGNRRMRNKLPYVAAFGYRLGLAMSTLILINRDKNISEDISTISSIFNIGISFFDYINDNMAILSKFKDKINEETLYELLTDINACKCFQTNYTINVDSTELRLLLKIISWFFLKIHYYHNLSKREDIWKRLISYIIYAYKSEIQSTGHDIYSKIDALAISKKKSTFPFLILYHFSLLVYLSNDKVLNFENNNSYHIIKTVGEIFWRTDDLVDLLKDLEYNQLNSILIQIRNNHTVQINSEERYKILIQILNGSYIQEISNEICSKIESLLLFLQCNPRYDDDVINIIRNLIIVYVRNWMGLDWLV